MHFSEDKSAFSSALPPGTRPAGTATPEEAAREVRAMFSRIAPRYDLLNRLLSLSFDRVWRRRAARRFLHILRKPGARALDLCCGTGDLALALERAARRAAGEGTAIWGTDFAHPMLVRAQDKTAQARGEVRYVEADALRLPFAEGTFDLVGAAFGFRNLADYRAGVREIFRVLRSGGEAGILEFSEPRSWVFAPFYNFYFRRVLPRLGGAISGDRVAYAYLPGSVSRFPCPEELAAWLEDAGFVEAGFECWMGGAVTLHRARKG